MATAECVPEASSIVGNDDLLLTRMACPNCGDALSTTAATGRKTADQLPDSIRCQSCKIEYLTVDCGHANIPWMFPDPELAHLEWSARYRGFLQQVSNEHNSLNRALNDTRLTTAGRQRVKQTLSAKREHRRQVSHLLAPIGLDADDLVPAMTHVLEKSLPKNQGLLSYKDNVFRDWAWDNGENEALVSGAEGLLAADPRESLGALLTLGAGAGRLSYDLHQIFSPTLSVLLDLNPLLLSLSAQIIQGEDVSLYEFPIAPIGAETNAVLQKCVVPEPIRFPNTENFRFVFGDATRPPFAAGSFDTVVTPWLIDILPHDLRHFLPQINRLLPVGGLWVNTGSLAFFDTDPCCRYSEKEVLELVESSGFDIVGIDHRTIPYLQSPHSAHGRTERIVSFAARKKLDVMPNRQSVTTPDWITDTNLKVPASAEYAFSSSSHLLTAQVLAAIDGKRSINAIARLVAREYDLSLEECTLAVQRILLDIQ